jgi:phospholipid/cholesterol/gamma-HCH transport system substrate-binding protein
VSHNAMRDVRLGLAVLLALVGLIGFVGLAGSGPGFLSSRRTIRVDFRDGQGIRVGSPVRVAGIDAGRVTAVELAEVEGTLRARLRISIPLDLAQMLRQDVKIAIESGLTGTSVVNIVHSGRSSVPLVSGQVVQGVESSFFDPVLEQVGLGPVERDHLRHIIAEVRQTAEVAGPRLRQVSSSLQETVAQLREAIEAARPAITETASKVEAIAQRLDAAKVEQTLARLDHLVQTADALLTENRPVLTETLAGVRGMITTDAPKIEALLDGLNGTRVRVDHVLASAGIMATQGAELLTSNRANLDRTAANVREATDYGSRLVQKLYGNPFYLSPFYKPTKEDVRAQEVYDAASTFLTGAKELRDAITQLQAIRSKPVQQLTASEREAYQRLYDRAWTLQGQLERTSQQLAEGLRETTRR